MVQNNSTVIDDQIFWINRINIIDQTITQYFSALILFVGNIGSILTAIVFWQPTFHHSSCATYFIACSIVQFFTYNFALITRLLQFGYNVEAGIMSLPYCKIRFYLFHIFVAIPRYNLILASIDRYFASSRHVLYRQWSSSKIACRLIIGNIILWCLVYTQILVFYEIDNDQCLPRSGIYRMLFSIYIMIDSGILPVGLMLVFGLLTIRNIHRSKKHVGPLTVVSHIHTTSMTHKSRISKKDNQLYQMLASQIFLFVALNLLNPCFLIYQSSTMYVEKSTLRKTAESFVSNMTYILIYASFSLTFPTFLISSKMFRQEFIALIRVKIFRRSLMHNVPQGHRSSRARIDRTTEI